MKNKLAFCLALFLILAVLCGSAAPASAAANMDWSIENGVLTVTGTGTIGPYNFASSSSDNTTTEPWEDYSSEINAIVVGEGITYISQLAFSELRPTEITLPSTLTGYYIGYAGMQIYSAFENYRLTRVNWNGTVDQWIGIQGTDGYNTYRRASYNLMYNSPTLYVNGQTLTKVVLTADSPDLKYDSFFNCATVTTLTIQKGYEGRIQYAFYGDPNLDTINFFCEAPEIDSNAFYDITATVNYIPYVSWEGKTQSYGGNLTWLPVNVQEQGNCGSDLTWKILMDGTLVISGSGTMTDYTAGNAPWDTQGYSDDITSVQIGAGVTHIGNNAFRSCANLQTVSILGSLVSVGSDVFTGCSSLTDIYFDGSQYDWERSANGAAPTLPNGVTIHYAKALLMLDADNGSEQERVLVTKGSCAPTPATPEKEGWHFLGWFEAGSDTAFDFANTPVNEDLILTARWEINTYRITYYANGGSNAPAAQIKTHGVALTLSDAVPTREGYDFLGWGRNSANAAVWQPGDSYTEDKDVTLYAVWRVWTYPVSYNANGGSGAPSSQTKTYGVTMTLSSAVPTREGYDFLGWATSADAETAAYQPGDTYSDNAALSLYAVWQVQSPYLGTGSCGDEGDNVTWTLDRAGNLTISGSGAMANYSYSSNNAPWYDLREQITNVVIESGVTTVGSAAFRIFSNLTSVTIPETVTSIGTEAFLRCTGLTSVTLPEGVTSIGYMAFNGCTGLTSVTLPAGLTTIGGSAFLGCTGLTDITIPASVTNIDNYAFSGCTAIDAVYITDLSAWCRLNLWYNETNPLYYAHKLYLNNELITDLVIPSDVASVGSYIFAGCSSLTSVTVPDTVTSFGYCAFSGCTNMTAVRITDLTAWCQIAFDGIYSNPLYYTHNLYLNGSVITNLAIPEGLTDIGENAFVACTGFRSVTIPDGVTSIGKSAFWNCTALTSVTIPGSVTSIGDYAFYYCGNLSALILPENLTEIGTYAFYNCDALTSVTVPGNVNSLGNYAFSSCDNLTDLTLGSGLTSIGAYAFSGCKKLTSVSIPDSVTTLGADAFQSCSGMTSLSIGNGVTSISASAFSSCSSLSSISFPASVTSIGASAFSSCTGLTSVTIPASVTSILNSAFYNCSSLSEVWYDGTSTMWSSITKGTNNTPLTSATRHCAVECGTVGNCRWALRDNGMLRIYGVGSMGYSSSPWSGLTASITSAVIEPGVTSISANAFDNCSSLTSVTIPDSVTSIGAYAFNNCSSLTGLTIPDGVTAIGTRAFYNCSNLAGITIPPGMTTISDYTFYKCAALTSITIPNGVKSIGEFAFYNCTGLTSISIPESVTRLNGYAFFGCTGLTSVTIPASVTSVGYYCFTGCTGLHSAGPIGSGCDYEFGWTDIIPTYAFWQCSSLTSVTIPAVVTSIGASSFPGCTGLTSITIPDGVTSIGRAAFSGCSSLMSVTIPASVTSIDDNAFNGCSSLENVYYSGCTLDQWDAIALGASNDPLSAAELHIAGHEYSVVWTWAEDHSAATAVITCAKNPEHGGTFEASIDSDITEVTCVSDGIAVYTASVEFDGQTYTDVYSETTPATGHHLASEPTWEGNEDFTSFNALFHCENCEYFESVEAEILDRVIEEPTCTEDGYISVVVLATYQGQDYFDSLDKDLPALGHSYGEPSWTWAEDHSAEAVFTCVCGHTEAIEAEVSVARTEPNCLDEGLAEYTATVIFNKTTYTDMQTETLAALGHTPGQPEWLWCDDYSSAEAVFSCVRDGVELDRVEAVIAEDRIEPTCTESGSVYYTASVNYEGQDYSDEQSVSLPALGHSYREPYWIWEEDGSAASLIVECEAGDDTIVIEATVVRSGRPVEPTHTEEGYTKYLASATYNGTRYTQTKYVYTPALGHSYGEPTWIWAEDYSEASAVFSCSCGDTYTVEATVSSERTEPTDYETGSVVYTAMAVLDGESFTDQQTVVLPALLQLEDGFYLIGPDWDLPAIGAAFTENSSTPGEYMLENVELAQGDELKVVRVENNAIVGWYPDDPNSPYVVDAGHAGQNTIYFRESYNSDWSEFGGYFYIVLLGHDTHTLTAHEAVPATCETAGRSAYWSCEVCGKFFSDAEATAEINENSWIIPALGHAWGEAEYTWAEDNSSVTATRVCANDTEHVEIETAAVTRILVAPPTQAADGAFRYVSDAFENNAFEIQVKDGLISALNRLRVPRFPVNLTAIEAEAFENTPFQAILIPDTVTSIGSRAFADCKELLYVYIPANVTSLAEDAFADCPNVLLDFEVPYTAEANLKPHKLAFNNLD